MAKFLNKDPQSFLVEKERFVQELRQFHDTKGTPFRNVPTIGGKEIDLYLLYWLVTAQGGWERINNRGGWEDLLNCFEIDDATLNAALGLKQVYMRHLEPYEKVHFQGEDDDREDDWYNDEEDSRTRRQKAQKIQATVPVTYNHSQHNISDEIRSTYGLSKNLYRKSDYDRLALSLLSPLPNEQDFAVNVCTLLSNEGKHTLKLTKYPRLLDLMLAHAGVYQHTNLQDYMGEVYKETRNYDMAAFWSDVCRDECVKDLLLYPPVEGAMSAFFALEPKEKDNSSKLGPQRTAKERLAAVQRLAKDEMARRIGDEDDLFAVGRLSGTQELAGQRVLQIATIIRNLSFEDDNTEILAKNLTCLRFCLLCASSKWNNLNQMGFDILSNISGEMLLSDDPSDCCITEVLLSTLTTCIRSDDRFQVISSLDILNKLGQVEANECYIATLLSDHSTIYDQLVSYLSLHDIHLLISTLECLYALSCHGEITCNAIARTHGALESLVSLVTVEAQSYGPKACILMRVVETVPGSNPTAMHPQQTQLQPLAAAPSQVVPQTITVNPTTNGLKPDQLAQLGQLTPIRPNMSGDQPQPQQQQQIITMTATPTQQSIVGGTSMPIMGQQGVIHGQLVQMGSGVQQQTVLQTQTMVQQQAPVLQLPRHPLPILRPGQVAAPINAQPTAMVNQQQIQVQPSMQLQPNSQAGSIIITTTANGTKTITQQFQPQQQQIQVQPGQQIPTVIQQQVRPTLVQGVVRPGLQQVQQQQLPQQTLQIQAPQQQPGTPAGSQQVQLRVSNDDANRQFCLSWLKATYELAPGSSIEQQVMYKQYLASLHKLGKREVISAQHYAVCIRTLFGGSVGPNRRTMPDGTTQSLYEGIKVRLNPLPLRFLGTPAPEPQQQQAPHQSVVVTLGANAAPPNPPGSPILTNLLHRKSPDLNNPQPTPKFIQPLIFTTSGGLATKNGVNLFFGPPLTNLNKLGVRPPQPQQIQVKEEESVLDGILPKDFGKPDIEGSGMLANLLDKKNNPQHMMNGVGMTGQKMANHLVNGAGGIKRPSSIEPNGDGNQVPPSKRAMLDCNGTLMANGPMSDLDNGPIVKSDVNLSQATFKNNNQQQLVMQQQGQQQQQQPLIVSSTTPGGQKIITGTDGKQYIVKTGPGLGNGTVIGTLTTTPCPPPGGVIQQQPQQVQQQVQQQQQQQQQQQHQLNGNSGQQVLYAQAQQGGAGKTIIILQPQAKVLTSTGQVVVQNPGLQAVAGQQTLVRAVTAQNIVPQQVTANTLTYTTRPQLVTNALPRQVVPTQPQQAQVPLQGVVRMTTSPAPQVTQVPTPPPPAAPTLVVTAAPTVPSVPIPKPDPAAPFLCEWHGCMKAFKSPKDVERHAIATHCPAGSDDIPCLWLRCDGMKRKRFSLMTHLQDRHCHPQLMKLMAVRRVQMATSGKSDVPLPPAPPPHPGYAPNAALHAIKRHAQEFVNPKALAMGDEKEGPVTKSIRLTSSLILKNLVMYSHLGKKRLRSYESHLSTIALSNVESSRTISQILFELTDYDDPSLN